MKKTELILPILAGVAVTVALLFLYGYLGSYLPSFYTHSEYLKVEIALGSVLPILPILISAYLMARIYKTSGIYLGILIGMLSALCVWGTIRILGTGMFSASYGWYPELHFIPYVIIGGLAGGVGELHGLKSNKKL